MRRYFADLLAVLSNRYQLCPAARHLAVYFLDLFMDHYDVAVRQLYVIALSCLLLASKQTATQSIRLGLPQTSVSHQGNLSHVKTSRPALPTTLACVTHNPGLRKFEEKEDCVPKLEQLNSLGFMCSLNLSLTKKDLVKMELLLLETFGWNLCMPTPAHFIDYYLHAAVQDGDLHNGWPLSSLNKTRAFMDKYTHYFLEVSLQDHAFLGFRPSQVTAACIAASRICLQITPSWTTVLRLLTGYSWDHLTQCIKLMLLAHDNDVKQANKSKSNSSSVQSPLQPQAHPSPSTQLLLQTGGYQQHLTQHSTSVSQMHMLGSVSQGAFPPFPSLTSGLGSSLPLQGPISMQVVLAAGHCLGLSYGGGYLGSHHAFTAGCFDR
ncbi:unnamed protein product [Oncorhynchus mykiss]|uniref:Cyclin-J-like protein n=1 Tax=Oncorhynchus mykiss TaxID=8022 RepID=A0A060XS78_ONCMY|nr:unnamed protein product [Oncorhynchus mykiss]